MKKILATLSVSAALAGAANAGDFGISLNFSDCGSRNYYPSYRSYSYCPPVRYYCPPPVVVYRQPCGSYYRGYSSYGSSYRHSYSHGYSHRSSHRGHCR